MIQYSRHACCTMVYIYAPRICFWNQQSFNDWLTDVISFSDNKPWFSRTKRFIYVTILFVKTRYVSTPTIHRTIANYMLPNKLGFMYQQDSAKSYTGPYLYFYSIILISHFEQKLLTLPEHLNLLRFLVRLMLLDL